GDGAAPPRPRRRSGGRRAPPPHRVRPRAGASRLVLGAQEGRRPAPAHGLVGQPRSRSLLRRARLPCHQSGARDRSVISRVLVFLFTCTVLIWPLDGRAGDFAQKWRTIETEHFYIHYYVFHNGRVGEEALAQRLAVVAEDARRRLVPFLGE